MTGIPRLLRRTAWLVAFFLVAACSSASDEQIGPVLQKIPGEVWDGLYGEGKAPGGPPSITPIDVDAYLEGADATVRALHEEASTRGFGDPIDAATLSYPEGVTATVAIVTAPGGRVGMVVGDPNLPEGSYFTTIDGDGVIEVSNPEFLVRFRPGGEIVEEWNAHSSCKVSQCIGSALGFWFDSWFMLPLLIGVVFTCGECDGEGLFDEVACTACVIPGVAFMLVLIPVAIAAIEECGFNDPCRWCVNDRCGSDEVTGRFCSFDWFDRSPTGADWVLLETRDLYYCANPDEYSFCRTRGEIAWVEDCLYGCDGATCAGPAPTCDPAACEQSAPVGNPTCEIRPDDDVAVIVQTFDEQYCRPADPRGQECVAETVQRAVEECEYGCSSDGQSCAAGPVCSASGLSPVPTDQSLPQQVATTRRQVIEAAVACDYDALASLASWSYFAYSFGDSGDPAAYWRSEEENGQGEPLRWMVETLNLPSARVEVEGDVSYVWPAAFVTPEWDSIPADEQAALIALYGESIIDDWLHVGGFARYRTGIGIEGMWSLFITGD